MNKTSLEVVPGNWMQQLAQKLLIAICVVMSAGLVLTAAVRASTPPMVVTHATQKAVTAELLRPVTHHLASPANVVKPTALSQSKSHTLRMLVTAYCPCKICCGENAKGITASGKSVTHDNGRFVAADTHLLPFGTRLSIPGYHDGYAVEVVDRGGAIKGKHIDVFYPTHKQAREWGTRYVDVTIEE